VTTSVSTTAAERMTSWDGENVQEHVSDRNVTAS